MKSILPGFARAPRLQTITLLGLASICFASTSCVKPPIVNDGPQSLHTPVHTRYHYREMVDRIYDPASIGYAGVGSREFQVSLDWWLSVTFEPVTQDSVNVSVTVDSALTHVLHNIPEFPIEVPANYGQGAHIEAVFSRSSKAYQIRRVSVKTKDSLTADNTSEDNTSVVARALSQRLPQTLSQIVAALSAPAGLGSTGVVTAPDTVYSQQSAQRFVSAVQAQTSGFTFQMPGEQSSGIQGIVVEYHTLGGQWLGTRLRRTMKVEESINLNGQDLTVAGTGTDSAELELLH